MKSPLVLVSGFLEEPISDKSDRARGRLGDHVIEIRFIDRGVGSTRDPYTEVFVLSAPRTRALLLEVAPQKGTDPRDVDQGLATDVMLGDHAFDQAFLVEAAPAEVVRELFDARIRQAMLRLGPLGVCTRLEGLLVEKSTWISDPAVLESLARLGAALAERIPVAFEAVERARLAKSAYRDGPPVARDVAAEQREIGDVHERRKLRQARDFRVGCLTSLAILVAASLLGLLIYLSHRP